LLLGNLFLVRVQPLNPTCFSPFSRPTAGATPRIVVSHVTYCPRHSRPSRGSFSTNGLGICPCSIRRGNRVYTPFEAFVLFPPYSRPTEVFQTPERKQLFGVGGLCPGGSTHHSLFVALPPVPRFSPLVFFEPMFFIFLVWTPTCMTQFPVCLLDSCSLYWPPTWHQRLPLKVVVFYFFVCSFGSLPVARDVRCPFSSELRLVFLPGVFPPKFLYLLRPVFLFFVLAVTRLSHHLPPRFLTPLIRFSSGTFFFSRRRRRFSRFGFRQSFIRSEFLYPRFSSLPDLRVSPFAPLKFFIVPPPLPRDPGITS